VFALYWRALGTPFVYDDFTHVTEARNADWGSVLAAFGPVENPPGLFFRPFGFLIYWWNYRLIGLDTRWWHATNLIFHAINSCLLFWLCRLLRMSASASVAAALLFVSMGSAVESLAWIDARFDPMATGFAMLSLCCAARYVQVGRPPWLALSCVAAVLGFLTKESAFCLPLLAGCLWFFLGWSTRLLRACAALTAVAVFTFAYRWWALGGIGGYGGSRFRLVGALNAVFVRDWTLLFFPINWSIRPDWLLMAFVYSAPVVLLLAAAIWIRIPRRVFIGCLLFTTFAAIPAQHLLLIGTDLGNSRVLYLPAAGWALLWASIFTSIRSDRVRVMLAAWLLCWHVLMVNHNLAFWTRVPAEAQRICIDFAQSDLVAKGPPHPAVSGLPLKKDGVVFLANGFPECVAMVSGGRQKVRLSEDRPDFIWNPKSGQIDRVDRPVN
jgi:hypothetical protein